MCDNCWDYPKGGSQEQPCHDQVRVMWQLLGLRRVEQSGAAFTVPIRHWSNMVKLWSNMVKYGLNMVNTVKVWSKIVKYGQYLVKIWSNMVNYGQIRSNLVNMVKYCQI